LGIGETFFPNLNLKGFWGGETKRRIIFLNYWLRRIFWGKTQKVFFPLFFSIWAQKGERGIFNFGLNCGFRGKRFFGNFFLPPVGFIGGDILGIWSHPCLGESVYFGG